MDAKGPLYHDAGAQPGLEVVPQEHNQSWPQVRDTSHQDTKELLVTKYVDAPHSQPELYSPAQPPLPPLPTEPADAAPEQRRRRRRWIIAGVVALLVILVAVLGGVLGSKAASSNPSGSAGGAPQSQSTASSTSTTTTAGSSGAPTPKPQSLQQGSAFAVTGMRKTDGGVDMFLFYQDPQQGLRYSRCDTARVGSNNTCWGAPVSFNTFVQPKSSLSVSSILYGSRFNAQTQLTYNGQKSRLLSTSFNDASTPNVAEDSVNNMEIYTGLNSSFAQYWPWTMYQDTAAGLHHVRNRLLAGFSPASEWDDNRINVTALAGSKLAIVPMSANFSRIALKGGYAVFYQGIDSRLAVTVTDLNSPELDSTYPLSWPTTIPSISLPRLAPIAAFSVARPSDPQQRVDTHVLYLQGTSIQTLYTDASGGEPVWKTSQPEALQGADPDTNIACLNLATSPSNSAQSEQLLEPASPDITKCFFQKAGFAMEATLADSEWTVKPVPIP